MVINYKLRNNIITKQIYITYFYDRFSISSICLDGIKRRSNMGQSNFDSIKPYARIDKRRVLKEFKANNSCQKSLIVRKINESCQRCPLFEIVSESTWGYWGCNHPKSKVKSTQTAP